MLEIHDAPAALPRVGHQPATPAAEDWLAVDEDDLAAAHDEACALILRDRDDAAAALRHTRSILVLQQILAARAIVRAGHLSTAAARAAFRSDHALGYYFGLAVSSGDPTAAPPGERAVVAALIHVHGLVFGMPEARRMAEARLTEVGTAFGDGLLAAEADLAAFALWRAGECAVLPAGLLDGLLPLAAWARGGDPVARTH